MRTVRRGISARTIVVVGAFAFGLAITATVLAQQMTAAEGSEPGGGRANASWLAEFKAKLTKAEELVAEMKAQLDALERQQAGDEAQAAAAQTDVAATADEGLPADFDLAAAEEDYKKCAVCHALNGEEGKIGPTLKGLFGRKSASVDGFQYSMAMKNLNIVWNEESIDQYLKNPTVFVPGARMLTGGIADTDKRRNLILYLKQVTK